MCVVPCDHIHCRIGIMHRGRREQSHTKKYQGSHQAVCNRSRNLIQLYNTLRDGGALKKLIKALSSLLPLPNLHSKTWWKQNWTLPITCEEKKCRTTTAHLIKSKASDQIKNKKFAPTLIQQYNRTKPALDARSYLGEKKKQRETDREQRKTENMPKLGKGVIRAVSGGTTETWEGKDEMWRKTEVREKSRDDWDMSHWFSSSTSGCDSLFCSSAVE